MKIKTVSYSEIVNENNPTLCLAPERFLNKCHRCPIFEEYMYKHAWIPAEERVQHAIKNMKCKPQIAEDIKERLTQKYRLLDLVKSIRAEINKINVELGRD